MKILKMVMVSIIFSVVYVHADNNKTYVKFLKTENQAGGMHTWVDKYIVTRNGKECIYEYGAGTQQGHIKNTCNGKEHWFKIREDKPYAKPLKYKIGPMIDPYFYGRAFQFLIAEGNKKPKDDTMISMKNSQGIKIFCFSNMKACKTEKEVLRHINK